MLNEHEQVVRSSSAGRLAALSRVTAVLGHWCLGSALFCSQMALPSAWGDESRIVEAKALTADEQKALVEFRKRYRMEKDQVVKYIKPPFLAGRLIDREHRWKDKWMNADYQKGTRVRAGLIPYCYIYFDRDGELAAPHHFSSGSDQVDPADQAVDVITVIEMITNIRGPNLIGSDKFSKQHVAGDWIIREGAPADKVIADFERVLNRECGVPIKLEYQEDTEDAVIVRRGAKPLAPKLDSPIKIYATTFRPDKGTIERGSFKDFLDSIGQSIEPNMRVVSQIENPPKDQMSWHVNVPERFDDGDVRSILENLDQQTGLKFRVETLKTQKINITRNE